MRRDVLALVSKGPPIYAVLDIYINCIEKQTAASVSQIVHNVIHITKVFSIYHIDIPLIISHISYSTYHMQSSGADTPLQLPSVPIKRFYTGPLH